MNTQMAAASQFKDLNEFLAKHSAKNEQKIGEQSSSTHTRIPDKDQNIYAGSYIIPSSELPTFYGLYYNSIFVQKRKEYLTERQLENGGPMAVDFDFRYNHDVTTRQHTVEHICDMVCEYSELLKECYLIEPNKPFDVFIFEKPNVNRLADGSLTKDGIHMIIGMQIDHCMQTLIRDKMVEQMSNVWQDLPLINTWDSVLDEGISRGKTNWQLFGSRKPGNEAYELTHHYIMTIDPTDGQFKMDEEEVSKFDLKTDFAKLSVQYDKHPKFEINPKIIDEYNKKIGNKPAKLKKASSKIKMNLLIDNDDECGDDDYISINDIKDKDGLDRAINLMLKNLTPNEYELKETHEFTQALPSKYYNPGSHLLNRQVAFKVTRKSIMYWLRKDNPDEYEKIKQTTAEYFLERAYETATEYDLAMVLKQMYKDRYVCVSYDKKGIWYQFKNHRWVTDKGLSLRSKISEEVYALITTKVERMQKEMFEYQEDDTRKAFLQKKVKVIVDLSIKLKRMHDHLASCLIGANKNQTFNVYHGSGSNGKSIVADLMSVTLGEYKGTVPITLVTDVRGKIGGTSDEVLKLKGVRYAVMQEPSKGVKLNEGIMKELTGGDPIQARGLYSESEIFEPQFNLVVCTNNLFDIESNDDGTWRRIRKCDFVSKFIDEGESYTDDTPYIYPKDKSLKDKLPALAPVFASMLVKRAFETGGIVENCATVENASNKYRRGQDHIAAFVAEMIVLTDNPNKFVNKSGLNSAFKKWYEETQGSRKAPKAEELHEYMNKKFGKPRPKGWYGVQFFEPDEEVVLDEL